LLGIDIPIVQAPMGGAVGPRMAAAVSNAGGLGTLPLWLGSIDRLRQQVRETKSLTTQPFAVNLNMEHPQEERLDACLEEGVPIISFFWKEPSELISRAKRSGAVVMQTVGNAEDARIAADKGADIIVAQGWESGGHVCGTVASMPLIPSVVDAVGNIPVIAAGGIADGRGLAAALALGASGVWIGTRFLACEEADINSIYQDGILTATEDQTSYQKDLFDVGWRAAPHRVLRNSTVELWEAAGSPLSGERPGEGEEIGKSLSRGDIVRYQSYTPAPDPIRE